MLTKVTVLRFAGYVWRTLPILVLGILAGLALGPLFYKVFIADRTAESVIAIATIALAIATVYLGAETRTLARDTVNSDLLADMHHQQSLSGLLALSSSRVQFGIVSDPSNQFFSPRLSLIGRVKNVGAGPALDIVMWMRHTEVPEHSIRIRLSALGPGKSYDLSTLNEPPVIVFENRRQQVGAPSLGPGPGTYVDVSIAWKNLFGGTQRAEYFVSSRLQRLEKRTELQIMRRELPRAGDANMLATDTADFDE